MPAACLGRLPDLRIFPVKATKRKGSKFSLCHSHEQSMLNGKHTVQQAQCKHASVAARHASEHAFSITCTPNIHSSDTGAWKHRVMEWIGLERSFRAQLAQLPLLWAGTSSTRPDWQELCPPWPWALWSWGIHNFPGQPGPVSHYPHTHTYPPPK